jgi:hypothetical protein
MSSRASSVPWSCERKKPSRTSHPVLVHATVWRYEAGSDAEHLAADDLLQEIVFGVPRALWRQDG